MSSKSLKQLDQKSKHQSEKVESLDATPTKYEYVENITTSSVAKINKYFDNSNNRQVAVKVFKDKDVDALREISILKEISNEKNKFCLYLIEYFCVKNEFFLVTLLHGSNLSDYLEENKVDRRCITDFSKQLVHAVDFLHQHDIVHTDIKPTNVVMTSFDNDLKEGIKLIDFGNAEREEDFKKEKADRKFISKDYRSPEMALSLTLDRKVDIWSLGCVLFRMFHNRKIIKVREFKPDETINRRIVEQARSLCQNGSKEMIEKSPEGFKEKLEEPKISYQEKFEAFFDLTDNDGKLLFDLLRSMLQFNPQLRVTSEDALKHKFFLQ